MTTSIIDTIEDLEALYGKPGEASLVKESDHVTPHYRAFIARSPFVALATSGVGGLDCSPRGDRGSVVRVADDKTLLLPDRRGNERIDSLRNIVNDPRVALLFLIPGIGTTLRVVGRATITTDPALLASFEVEDKTPRSVIVVAVEAVYFQCARAIVRSELWNPERHAKADDVPSVGEMLAELSERRIGGEDYDRAWPDRAKATLW